MKKNNDKYKSYMLRTCNADMTSRNGFVWPKSGHVECTDWNPNAECGNGLHGLLMGVGDASLMDWSKDANWLVVGIYEWVELDGKVKTPSGAVVFCGTRNGAIDYLISKGADPSVLPGGQATASGDWGQATASGREGQATASGFKGQATASGREGQALAGIGGKAAANELGILAIRWWDEKKSRVRIAVGYVGEKGIEPNRYYRVEAGKLKATDEYVEVAA